MFDIMEYVRPELVIVAICCYILGLLMKRTTLVADNHIPIVNLFLSVMLCTVYTVTTCGGLFLGNVLQVVFTGITQGILTAGLATFANQLIKQGGKSQ